MSRVDFVKRLIELTEKDYPIALPLPGDFYDKENVKEYSREVYDNSFKLWKTISSHSSRWNLIYTVIYVRILDEPDDTISIRYSIRFNLMNIGIGMFLLFALLYVAITDELVFSLYALIAYTVFLTAFNYMVKDDKHFLKVLTNKINPWKLV